MKYCQSFIQIHKRLAPALPIGRFADIVNPRSIGFNSQNDFFAPVRFSVQVAEGVTGAIRLDIATEKNPNWLQDMKNRLTETLGVDAIELKTVTGKPLEKVARHQLHNVGKLFVYDAETGKPIRVPSLPPVPPEYRVTKITDLKQWTQKLGDFIPAAVAAVLKGKDQYQVDTALLNEGEVLDVIEKQIEKQQDWAEFVRLHQSSSSKTEVKPEDAQKLLRKVSKQILVYIRNFVGASKDEVKRQIILEQSQKLRANKEDDHLLKPVLSGIDDLSHQPTGKSNNKLFQNLVEDALGVPMLQKSLVAAIYNFDSSSAHQPNQVIASQRPAMKRVASNHHPWYAHIHHTLLPIRGSYPSDYLARHTRQDMSAKAPFIGDIAKVYQAYHKFSGVHTAPPPLRIKGGIPQVSAVKARPKLIPVDTPLPSGIMKPMPELVPVDEPISIKSKSKLIPVDSELLGCHHGRRASYSGSDIEEEIGAMLIPVDSEYISCHNGRGRRGSYSGSDIEAEMEDVDAVFDDNDFSNLPSVNDVFN